MYKLIHERRSDAPNLEVSKLYIDNFLEMLEAERAASLNTVSAYKLDLESFANFFPKKELTSVKLDDIRGFIRYLSKQGYNPRSINRKISALKQFYQFLVSESVISDNPTIEIDLQKQTQSLPKKLEVQEIDTLFHSLAQEDTPESIRLACMLAILYSAGLRVSELVSLKLSNFEIRLLSKLASGREFEGGPEHRTGMYIEVHEDLGLEPTYKLPAEVEFRKKSIT
ncbi:MAG: site-specific integrase, partial [Pseudomonadota bacterium]